MAYAKYNRSAVDIISPMLTINQQAAQSNEAMKNRFIEGAKGLVEGGAKAYTFYQRQKKIEYIGDNELEKLKQELADTKAELESVRNQMRVIKAEDLGSLDVEVDAETTKPYDFTNANPVDYDTMSVDGARTFPAVIQPGMKALGGI